MKKEERRDEHDALGVVQLVEIPGQRPPGRPKETWRSEGKPSRCAGSRHKYVEDHR